jgi:trimethylamine--corrinoid protein Co-methyltransferase
VDIRTGIFSIGSPEARIATAVATQMARHYELPVRGHGSLTDAKTVNAQSGSESMFSITNTLLNRCNFVLHSAGALDSYTTVSPEKFVLDCERIRMVERFLDGFEFSEERLAMELLEDVDPGGHFLDQRHTLTHGQEEQFFPNLFDRQSHDAWEDDGEPDPFELAHERVEEHVDAYERPPMDADVEAELQSYADAKREEILTS